MHKIIKNELIENFLIKFNEKNHLKLIKYLIILGINNFESKYP